jgi:hypothetical protein
LQAKKDKHKRAIKTSKVDGGNSKNDAGNKFNQVNEEVTAGVIDHRPEGIEAEAIRDVLAPVLHQLFEESDVTSKL